MPSISKQAKIELRTLAVLILIIIFIVIAVIAVYRGLANAFNF